MALRDIDPELDEALGSTASYNHPVARSYTDEQLIAHVLAVREIYPQAYQSFVIESYPASYAHPNLNTATTIEEDASS